MGTDQIVLLVPLSSQRPGFCQGQKTAAVQERRTEYVVEAFHKRVLPRTASSDRLIQWLVPVGRSIERQYLAGPAFTDCVSGLDIISHVTTLCHRHHFFLLTSVNIRLSSARSVTICFSCSFSRSSSSSRLDSEISIPPNLLHQR